MLKAIKNKKSRTYPFTCFIVLSLILICFFFNYQLLYPYIADFTGSPTYESIRNGGNSDTAIFYIRGELDWRETMPIDEREWEQVEPQLFNIMVESLSFLQKEWDCDLFVYYQCLPDFSNYTYENIFLIFGGHSDGIRFFMKEGAATYIHLLSNNIQTTNLTTLVSSCHSVNWNKRFHHENLTALFTSDLTNENSYFDFECMIENDFWLEVTQYRSYNYFFLSSLGAGGSYYLANQTAFQLCNHYGLTNYTLS